MKRILFNFQLALDGVMDNRLRAVLTALGIVFGVAAVIAMLAIGTGAKVEILERMKLIGTNNIEIKALEKPADDSGESSEEENATAGTIDDDKKRPYSPGLTLKDANAIARLIPTVEKVSPEIVLPVTVIQSGLLKKANCVGVTNAFFEFNNLFLEDGRYFHPKHSEKGSPVCIIGNNIKSKFFSKSNPIGQQIKCGENWMTIIGVLGKRKASRKNLEELGIRDYNADVYIPIETALIRYKNRGAITANKVSNRRNRRNNNSNKDENYHQLDRLVVRVNNSDDLINSAGVVGRMLKRRHRDLRDFEVEVPELLLEQQQETQNTFNVVLAVIAGISLLVGGIGIMNIMLATVLERIKEIGVRRSLGATRSDIIYQFLFESVFMSLIGGIIGIFLGIAAAEIVASYANIPTIVSTWSIALSFGVAATVGLVFGIVPARRAAYLDPIKALRND